MSWNLDAAHSQVDFSAKHMGIMTVRGRFTDVQATIEFNEDDFTASSVAATINAASISTNDERRDGHLRSADFFDVEHYPTLTFKSTVIERAAHDRYRMTGDLTMHGVTRPVSLDVVYSGQAKDPYGNTHAGFSGETTINRKDWGLGFNVALETGGFMVSEDIKIALEIEALKTAETVAAA
ncbi:MAG TPA: YceI family protein [Chloroflexota bacterium]|nr:YceI family protein [Chloroflexota bacterium]